MRSSFERLGTAAALVGATLMIASPALAQRAAAVSRREAHTSVRGANIDANVNRGATVNANRNVNVNANRNVDVNVNRNVNVVNDVHYDAWGHPVATAVAATTAAVAIGTMVTALPRTGCSGISAGGVTYQRCGATYYKPVYQGTTVQYVVVTPP